MARCVAAVVISQLISGARGFTVLRTRDSQILQEDGKTSLADQFQGLRVAIAWHGFYQRNNAIHERGGTCSDFFHVAPNIDAMITGPLVRAGAKVSHYVHTYHREDCPAKDKQLLDKLRPVRSFFWNVSEHRIVDSYIEALKMVEYNKASLDFVLVLRFDVGYQVPVTQWNMTLDAVNVPFYSHPGKEAATKVSDLLYALPIKYVPDLTYALDESGKIAGRGAGHLMYGPLSQRIGKSNINVMDKRAISSARPVEDMKSFLGIDRNCGPDYYKGCPSAPSM